MATKPQNKIPLFYIYTFLLTSSLNTGLVKLAPRNGKTPALGKQKLQQFDYK